VFGAISIIFGKPENAFTLTLSLREKGLGTRHLRYLDAGYSLGRSGDNGLQDTGPWPGPV